MNNSDMENLKKQYKIKYDRLKKAPVKRKSLRNLQSVITHLLIGLLIFLPGGLIYYIATSNMQVSIFYAIGGVLGWLLITEFTNRVTTSV